MKKHVVFIFLILLIGLISACSNDESANTIAGNDKSSRAITENDVFQKSCITCHSSGDINGGEIKLDSVKIHDDFKDKSSLYNFVSNNMPKSAPGSLSKEEYQAVVNYLWGQKK
ncbi:c-type cytochrome [Neobacillus ginsengisoli]|uniref:Cytochrome c5 n=1 Tax=Neobacillus ginsengisoli TaxID=904295 RepID=A0ABT9XWI4_9BACI|nr:cytochrome c [Neobacillus ginsengisoli]MDQ0199926.1 cytochrome c5 [Neobacillus ginsengisoli]